MAVTSKLLFRGAASTGSTTLYTQPNTSTTTVVTNIVITNTAASTSTATINIDGVAVVSGIALSANGVTTIDLKQVIPPSSPVKTITGLAGASTVNFHISGVEIS